MTNPPHRYILFLSARASTGSVTSESKSVTSPVPNAKKTLTLGGSLVRKGSFFSTKLYRDHIDILLSEMGYSELVQRLFEKMTFFLVDPLLPRLFRSLVQVRGSSSIQRESRVQASDPEGSALATLRVATSSNPRTTSQIA